MANTDSAPVEGDRMGIKLFEFLRRTAGITSEQFHTDWREVHGPMLADDPLLRRHVKRYELNHRLPSDADRERTGVEVRDDGWDGVAVLWFDSMDELRALSAEPTMAAIRERAPALHQDERLIVITEDPDTIITTPHRDEAGAKMLCILHRNRSLDLDTFHEHWLKHHGGLFQNIAGLRDPLLGYDQNHGLRDPDAAFDGVTEQWFESLDTFVASLSVPEVRSDVNPDVAYMLDPASIHFVMAGRPTVLID
ncbi:MAG TPA: EthD domain-containing protein [Frankiaceae bacterium]|nr:EthD domain-containing protein [Frankiaceae bacterium]